MWPSHVFVIGLDQLVRFLNKCNSGRLRVQRVSHPSLAFLVQLWLKEKGPDVST